MKVFLISIWLVCVCSAAAAMAPINSRECFITADEPASIRLRNTPSGEEVTLHISDFHGHPLRIEKARGGKDGITELTVRLPTGYYEISLNDQSPPVGLVSLPKVDMADSFFGIDGALSWLAPAADRAPLTEILNRTGIATSRERLSWHAIHPERNHRNWRTPREYDSAREVYRKSDVKIVEMFHDAPRWLGAAQGGRFPDDLPGAAASWREIAARWHAGWRALEVWNEPDIAFGGNQPADQLLPLIKTVRHVLRSSTLDTPLVGGAFAYLNKDYLNVAAHNGLLDECDAVSFHYYGDPLGLQKHVGELREWLKAFDRETKPLWITEIGSRWMGDPALRPTAEVQLPVAATFAMDAVEAKACGIAAYFPFVYVRYNESQKNFGILDGAGAPLRSMAAYIQAIRMLSGRDYMGDVPLADIPSARRSRVFGSESAAELVVAVYTGDHSADAAIHPSFPVENAWGVDGRAIVSRADGSISSRDGLIYLQVRPQHLQGKLERTTEAARLFGLGRAAPPALPPPSPIVLQPILEVETLSATSRGYMLPETDGEISGVVRINNLSEVPQHVDLKVGDTKTVAVEVAPVSREEFPLNIRASELSPGPDGMALYNISAKLLDGGRIAPAVLPFVVSRGLQEHLKAHAYQFNVPIGEAHRWKPNHAPGKETFARTADARWGLSISFEGGERWSFPRFSLPQEVDHDRVTGVLIRARATHAAVKLMCWDIEGAMEHTPYPIIKADGNWHVTHIPLSSFLSAEEGSPIGRRIQSLSIGINALGPTATLEVSDLYLLGQ